MSHDSAAGEARTEVSRRHLLHGAAVAGVAVPLLSACGSDETGSPEGGDTGGGSDNGSGDGASGATVAVADVPVGGGVILTDAQIVVTQPTEGDFKAFTAICTHRQCPVDTVSEGTINCPCHGSKYAIEDGSVVAGPAPQPLAPKEVAVKGDQVSVT